MKKLATMSLICVLTSGCAAGKLNEEVAQLKQSLMDLRQIQADQGASIMEIRAEVGRLGGKFEEMNYAAKGRTEEIEKALQMVSSRVPPPPGVPADMLAEDESAIAPITGEAADLFRLSLQQLRVGEFESAKSGFQRFYDENPQTAFSDNALFWVGICFDQLRQFDRSIGAYSQVFQKLPAEDRAPAAVYYLAEAFLKMGSKEEAVLALQKVIDDYPKSSFAQNARGKLATLQPAKSGKSKKR